ncbi:glutaminase [Microbacterium sp. BWT-B31]|uniref:glutaminase n=1 Tax=Microbacterium sp. BWT-B31 TaxID=3232072 RepID=UPI0035281F06
MASVAELLAHARVRLADAPRVAVGEVVEPRRILGIARASRIVPRGTAWHLGAVLLTDDGMLATGEVVRSRLSARRGYTAESQRRRGELAEAAHRARYPEGTPVHLGWTRVDLDALARGEASGPLAVIDGVPSVRWSPAAGYQPLEAYLAERIDLLVHPPERA